MGGSTGPSDQAVKLLNELSRSANPVPSPVSVVSGLESKPAAGSVPVGSGVDLARLTPAL